MFLGGYLLEKDIYLEESHMDKGFNDDELADIMNEIESLEKEFNEEPSDSVEVQPEVQAEVEEPVAVEETITAEEPVIAEEPVMEEEAPVEVEEEPVQEVVQEPIAEHEPIMVTAEQEVHEEHVEVDTEMEEVLTELSEMPVEDVVASHEPHDDEVVALRPSFNPKSVPAPAVSGGHSSMSFTVEGDMKLDLSFNVSGKVVHLNISENGFELELEGGMKFSIPIDEAHSNKKAA